MLLTSSLRSSHRLLLIALVLCLSWASFCCAPRSPRPYPPCSVLRQPCSETSCSCVLVDWFTLWCGGGPSQPNKRREEKGTSRAMNCTLFSPYKCKQMWPLNPSSDGIVLTLAIGHVHMYIVYICVLCSFFFFFFLSMCRGGRGSLLSFRCLCQL